jgi:hypothetical protein
LLAKAKEGRFPNRHSKTDDGVAIYPPVLARVKRAWIHLATASEIGWLVSGRFVVDAHRDDGKRYVVRSDEKLTAFLEAEKVTRDSPQTAVKVAIAAKARQ